MPDYTGRVIDAEKLRRLMDAKLWSIGVLAQRSGVATRTIKYALSDAPADRGGRETMRSRNAHRIADALGVDIDAFSRPYTRSDRTRATA